MAGTYVGARTPPRGTTRVGVVTRFTGGHNALPLPTADLIASYSPTDNTSLHVRALLLSFGGEALARWRFFHTDNVHLALAPSFAAALWPSSSGTEEEADYKALGNGANVLARGNFLFSTDMGGGADLDLAGFAGVSRITRVAVPAGDDAPYAVYNYEMQGTVIVAGGAVGVSQPTSRGPFRVAIEWMRFVTREAHGPDAPKFEPRNLWTLTLTWEH